VSTREAVLRRHWFPVALSHRLQSRPISVQLLDTPIALARDSRGQVFALEDRCPHRGAPLSSGSIEDDVLVCPYHGWSFGSDGHCRAMPGTAPLAEATGPRAQSWQAQERDGIVWLCAEPGSTLPDRLLALDPHRRRFLWETTWHAPVIEAQDNFLDALHTHRVHPGLVRRDTQRRPVTVQARGTRDGFQIDYLGQQKQSGLLFRLFESPRTRERAHFSGLSVAQLEYRYVSGWAAFITLCFSPVTATSTRVFTMLHVENRFAPAWLVRLVVWPFLRKVAMQDRRILHLQRANLEHFPLHRHIVTPVDIARPLLERAWRGVRPDEVPEYETTIWI
jgi:phenylpropionate dioxygenase-like ring-hydroxylating dioxygenase large terminal subunit